MKKIFNLKLMLLGLLAFGSSNAFAQPQEQDLLDVGNYRYEVTKISQKVGTQVVYGNVKMLSVVTGGQTVDENQNLIFPKEIEVTQGTITYKYWVTEMASDVFKNNSYDARHAVIPAKLTEIPTGAFNTLTNLYDLTFEEGSEVTKIGPQAFASTQISSFDFSPCTKLEGLQDGVFVQEKAEGQQTENVNANITTITLPTSTAFKHINGAFRNLPALTTINNLENSWIRELVDGAFSGCSSLKTLSLPGNDLQYISKNALQGSAIEDLTVNVGTGVTNGNYMKFLGGCTVAYVFDEETQSYIYNYEGEAYDAAIDAYNEAATQYNEDNELEEGDEGYMEAIEGEDFDLADSDTNLYGFNENKVNGVRPIAPLRKLTLAGTLQGKICTNAFAWCDYLNDATKATTTVPSPEFVVSDLFFGSKAQIEEHAFYKDIKIASLTLNDINDNKLEDGQYTIEANAFEGCPIATLNLGNIMTNNAIGEKAFGNQLKNVTIKTVKASRAAFATQAFVWDNVSGATLSLAAGDGEYVSSDNPDANGKIIVAKAFDFSGVVGKAGTFVWPVVTIGEIKSQGGVFAEGAIEGKNVEEMHFTGDINTDGLDESILAVSITYQNNPVYEQEPVLYYENPAEGQNGLGDEPVRYDSEALALEAEGLAVGQFVLVEEGVYNKIKEITVNEDTGEPSALVYDTQDKIYTLADLEAIPGGYAVSNPASLEEEAPVGSFVKTGDDAYKMIEDNEAVEGYHNKLKVLTFAGKIKTDGIGEGAFCNFQQLETLSFAGLLSKEAVAAGSFTGTGKVNTTGEFKGFIGTKTVPFVTYTADLTANDASENPFATNAFGDQRDDRIIYWSVSDEDLAKAITNAIQQDVEGDLYLGETVNPKFNVYKWVAIPPVEPAVAFIVFTDNKEIALDQNTNAKLAWGRYDLGSFLKEGNVAGQELEATDMIIDRYQKTTDVSGQSEYNVKVTLYGMYWDQDDKGKKSDVYMVPLEVINGQYLIPLTNEHLIIAKVENLDGEFAEDQILVQYTVPEAEEIEQQDDEQASALDFSSVWDQLTKETAGEGPVKQKVNNVETIVSRIFTKAEYSWTNQELVDAVTNEGGQQNVASKDLHVLLDPSVNAGFDVKRLIIERKTDGTGAYIGVNWYYALLKNYGQPSNAARVIWLDYEQATAIFGVQAIKTNASDNSNAIYNLQGVRVDKPSKGIYIQNGKKIVVK